MAPPPTLTETYTLTWTHARFKRAGLHALESGLWDAKSKLFFSFFKLPSSQSVRCFLKKKMESLSEIISRKIREIRDAMMGPVVDQNNDEVVFICEYKPMMAPNTQVVKQNNDENDDEEVIFIREYKPLVIRIYSDEEDAAIANSPV